MVLVFLCNINHIIDQFRNVLFVFVNMFKYFYWRTPGSRNYINLADNDVTTTIDTVVNQLVCMSQFFTGLFFHPMSKTVQTFFFEVNCHRQIQV